MNRMVLLIEQSKKVLMHIAKTRPLWKVMLEDDKIRFITGQLVLSYDIIRDLELEFKMQTEDIIFTPNYGITVSMRIRELD